MKSHTQATATTTTSGESRFTVAGLTLAGLELPGSKGGGGRTRGMARRRSRRRNFWMPVWAVAGQ